MSKDIFTRIIPLPDNVHAMTHVNQNGSFTILLNANNTVERRLNAYRHELERIQHGNYSIDTAIRQFKAETHNH